MGFILEAFDELDKLDEGKEFNSEQADFDDKQIEEINSKLTEILIDYINNCQSAKKEINPAIKNHLTAGIKKIQSEMNKIISGELTETLIDDDEVVAVEEVKDPLI